MVFCLVLACSAAVDHYEQIQYIHPGPSDEQLIASAAMCEHASIAAVSAAAAAAAEEGYSSMAQEDRELAQAMAASLAESAPILPDATTEKDSIAGEREEQKQERKNPPIPPDEEFFWVEAEWIRQWIVGQHADSSNANGAGAAAAALTVANGGTSSRDPVVLDVDSPQPKGGGGGDGSDDTDAFVKKTEEGETAVAAVGSDGKGYAMGDGTKEEQEDPQDAAERSVASAAADASLNETPKPLQVKGGVKRPVRPKKEKGKEHGDGAFTGDVKAVAEIPNGVENAAAADGAGGGENGTTTVTSEPVVTLSGADAMAVAMAAGVADDAAAPTPPNGVFAQPMRNRPLLCAHGKLHPSSVWRLKLVSRKVYEGMLEVEVEVEDGAAALHLAPDGHIAAGNYYCALCVKEHIGQK